jgi:hypothetical protein
MTKIDMNAFKKLVRRVGAERAYLKRHATAFPLYGDQTLPHHRLAAAADWLLLPVATAVCAGTHRRDPEARRGQAGQSAPDP